LLSELRFGSFLVYAPRGTSEVSRRAQQFVRALKEERPIGAPRQSPSDYAARRLAEEIAASLLADFFLDEPLLVPVPRSSLSVEGGSGRRSTLPPPSSITDWVRLCCRA